MSSRNKTILIVDDEPEIREAIGEMLRETAEYIVIEASSGPAALKISGQYEDRIDLLLTDLIMPGMTGRQLADILRARCPGLEVIFMSGYVDESRGAAMEKDFPYIQKPLDFDRLENMIGELWKAKKTKT